MPPVTNEIFDQIDTNNDGIITRSEFNGAVVAIQRPPNGPVSSGATANAIFDRIDVNHDGRITRSEFNSHVAVQRQVPMATATARVPSRPQRAEVISCDLSREVQLAVRSCMETERNLWHTSPQFDEIIASKVSAWFQQLKGEELQKSESVAAHFEGTVAKLREEFDTLRSSQSANTEKIQQEVEELHTLRHLVESRMSEVCQTHRDTDEVSRELHSQISLRLGKNHEGLCSLLEKEQQQRSQDIKELSDTLGARVTEYLNQESHERASQLEDLSRRVEADSVERLAKLVEQQGWQTEVEGTNQELVTHVLELREVYRTLENAFNQFFGENTEKHDAVRNRNDQLESLVGTHQEKMESDYEKFTEDVNMKMNELRSGHTRVENIVSMEKERNNTRHKESGEDLNTKYTRIMEVFEEERAAWEAKIHELQPKVDTALFRMSAFDAEIKGGLDGAHNKMLETASNLETSFLTRQQQCINQTEAANQQIAKVFKDEIAQRDLNIQQMQSSLQEEILRAVAKSDVYKEECMKEFGTMQKSLESGYGDLLSTISTQATSTSQEARDLVVATRSELEKSLIEQDGRLQHLHFRLGEFHENIIKAKEDVQAEHSRSLECERDARSQQVKDLEEYFSNQLSNAKIQMGDRTEIGTMFELERQSRNDMLVAEASNRARALDELTDRVVEHINMSIQGEKNERDTHCKNLLERIELENAQHKQHTERFEDHNSQHKELLSSHQELMSLTRELEASHAGLATRLEDVHELHSDNFVQHASSHKTALLEQENALQKKYDAAIDDIRVLLQGIESTTNLDRSAHQDRHTDFKYDVEARLKELEALIQGNRSLWEARFSLLEPRVDTTAFRLDSFQSDLNNATAAWREQLGDLETSLTQSFQANLQQIIGDVDVVHREITESVQQQNAQWSVGIKEVAEKFAQDISNTAGNSQRIVAELKQEIFPTLKELDRSVMKVSKELSHQESWKDLSLRLGAYLEDCQDRLSNLEQDKMEVASDTSSSSRYSKYDFADPELTTATAAVTDGNDHVSGIASFEPATAPVTADAMFAVTTTTSIATFASATVAATGCNEPEEAGSESGVVAGTASATSVAAATVSIAAVPVVTVTAAANNGNGHESDTTSARPPAGLAAVAATTLTAAVPVATVTAATGDDNDHESDTTSLSLRLSRGGLFHASDDNDHESDITSTKPAAGLAAVAATTSMSIPPGSGSGIVGSEPAAAAVTATAACATTTIIPKSVLVRHIPFACDEFRRKTSGKDRRKSVRCRFFAEGCCTRGEKCRWSHAENEAHPLPPPRFPSPVSFEDQECCEETLGMFFTPGGHPLIK